MASAALAGTIGNVNTAFLNQQGSAFVSAPANAQPDQPGGGVWGRAVGGEADLKSSSASMALTKDASGAVIDVATTACANSQHQSFAGVQVGADRLDEVGPQQPRDRVATRAFHPDLGPQFLHELPRRRHPTTSSITAPAAALISRSSIGNIACS